MAEDFVPVVYVEQLRRQVSPSVLRWPQEEQQLVCRYEITALPGPGEAPGRRAQQTWAEIPWRWQDREAVIQCGREMAWRWWYRRLGLSWDGDDSGE